MTWLNVPLVMLVVTLCVSSAEEKDILEVRYQQRTISVARGSSATLSCKAYYDLERCGLVQVVWFDSNKQNAKLTNPSKYFTTVNETMDGNRRVRQVVTEILDVTAEDTQFQCKAQCETGDKAMGHFIWIIVTD